MPDENDVREDARAHYRMLRRRGAKHDYAKRIAEGTAVPIPTLTGLDSGDMGFMRGRTENDGCPDQFTRERVKKKYGGSMGGGFFVPGLCRPGVQFDPQAVCHSRQEVVDKAKKLGVAVRGPGINVDPRENEAELRAKEEPYAPSERALRYTIRDEVKQRHGGKISGKKYRELVAELKEKHGEKKRPASKAPDSLYPAEMANRPIPARELIG